MIDQHTIGPYPVVNDTHGPSGWPIEEASKSVEIGGILYTFQTEEDAAKAATTWRDLIGYSERVGKLSRELMVIHKRNQIRIVKQ